MTTLIFMIVKFQLSHGYDISEVAGSGRPVRAAHVLTIYLYLQGAAAG